MAVSFVVTRAQVRRRQKRHSWDGQRSPRGFQLLRYTFVDVDVAGFAGGFAVKCAQVATYTSIDFEHLKQVQGARRSLHATQAVHGPVGRACCRGLSDTANIELSMWAWSLVSM